MTLARVKGIVRAGHRVASSGKVMPETVMDVIRNLTGFTMLRPGTLNVKVEEAHVHRPDYTD